MSEVNTSATPNAGSELINPSQPQVEQQAQPKAEPAKEAPKASNKKSYELKVNNQIRKMELDLDNDQEITKHLSKAAAFDSKAQEAAELRKQIDSIADYLNTAKGDKATMRQLIRELGGDERELAQMIMEEQLEQAKKSPEQLEHEKVLQELEKERKRAKSLEDEKQSIEMQRLLEAEQSKIDTEMTEVLESAGVPKNAYFVKRLADYALIAAREGVDVPMKDLVPLVMKEVKEDLRQLMDLSKDEFVEDLLSKDRIANIRKKHLAASRSQGAGIKSASSIKDTGSNQPSEKALSPTEKKVKLKDYLWGSGKL